MTTHNKSFFVLLIALVGFYASFSLASESTAGTEAGLDPKAIEGDWMVQTNDAVIRIFEQDGVFRGRVVWAGRETQEWWQGEPPFEIPWDNKKAAKKYKLAASHGVDILAKLEFDGSDKWINGRVFNVINGKIYRCQLSLENPDVLKLRGYVGMPVFGGSVLWTRLTDEQRNNMPVWPNRFEHPETWP